MMDVYGHAALVSMFLGSRADQSIDRHFLLRHTIGFMDQIPRHVLHIFGHYLVYSDIDAKTLPQLSTFD